MVTGALVTFTRTVAPTVAGSEVLLILGLLDTAVDGGAVLLQFQADIAGGGGIGYHRRIGDAVETILGQREVCRAGGVGDVTALFYLVGVEGDVISGAGSGLRTGVGGIEGIHSRCGALRTGGASGAGRTFRTLSTGRAGRTLETLLSLGTSGPGRTFRTGGAGGTCYTLLTLRTGRTSGASGASGTLSTLQTGRALETLLPLRPSGTGRAGRSGRPGGTGNADEVVIREEPGVPVGLSTAA